MLKKILILVIFLLVTAGISSAGDVQVEQLAKSTTSWNGVSLPDCSEKETEVTVLKITIAPHTRLPLHYHPVINVAYMLAGKLTVISEDGKKKIITPGESLIELVNEDHYGINEGDVPVEIVVVYIGETGQAITVKE